MDFIQMFNDGGWAMYPLLALSVVALACVFERIIVMIMLRKKMSPAAFLDEMTRSLQDGDKEKSADELIDFCKKNEGVVSIIMESGLTKYKETLKNKMSLVDSKEWIQAAIDERSQIEIPDLEKRLSIISTVAMVAPLMGLLGTVSGMIVAFTTMSESAGGAKPDELAGGISQALITTATGLIIAIPALIVYNILRSKVDDIILEIDEVTIYLTDNFLEK